MNTHAIGDQMMHILEGLRHLHTFPTPIAHGDLNPVEYFLSCHCTKRYTDIMRFPVVKHLGRRNGHAQTDSFQPVAADGRYAKNRRAGVIRVGAVPQPGTITCTSTAINRRRHVGIWMRRVLGELQAGTDPNKQLTNVSFWYLAVLGFLALSSNQR
jgi:hypothetical protein